MAKTVKKGINTIGLPPGTLPVREQRARKVNVSIMEYDRDRCEENQVETIEQCLPLKEKPTVTWINIDGVDDIDVIEKVGKYFNLHPLTLEDITDREQRPKLEDFENYIFMVLKIFYYDREEEEIQTEQVSMILGSNFVISFQEREGDVFGPIRERIRMGKGRIRQMRADYLAYALVDTIVDNYFVIPDKLGEKMDSLQEELIADPSPEILEAMNDLKKNLITLRKSIWPLREVISALQRVESPLIQESTGIYLRDVYDHTIRVIDTIETSRDILSGMLEIYLSSISNRMNQVMKVLTIIATIFIPLTFIAGIYGMNFKYLPELGWKWSYPVVLLGMVFIGVSMLVYFKRKRWF